ncbi:MAG: ABC transporter ATP-binding protein [Eubacteriaceae bacterium]|nr:ABC transporter ATP-binding protein [Eubacteriaceae bacterium]
MEYSVSIKNLTKIYKIYEKSWHRAKHIFFRNTKYKKFYALKNITIDIPKGEAVGVLGKNGAGKSTLLKIITGVTTPTSGSIEVNGKISALLELTSGFDSELTGIENIYLKALTMGMQKKEMDSQLQDIIEFADIGDHIHQPVRTYSSGMKARLGFAISVNVDPDILIVDEALSVGDDIFKLKCIERMEQFKEQGKTILFVSHSLFTVKSFCNKCMWIKDGELVSYGDTGEIMLQYENYLKEERAKEKKQKRLEAKESNTDIQIMEKKEIVEFKNFKFRHGNGEENNKFLFGEDVFYTVEYEVKKPMKNLKWSFTLRDAETTEIFGSDKRSDKHYIKSEVGKHSLRVTLKELKLLPGKYLLSGEVRDDHGALHIGYANRVPFVVEGKDFVGTGINYIDHEYEN